MRIEQIDYTLDVEQALLWQYDKATALISLVTQKQEWLDINQTEFWSDWYTDVYNLYTANSFGLSVWSIILDIPYFVRPMNPFVDVWGFNEYPPINPYVNFDNGVFGAIYDYDPSRPPLTVEEQRIVLKLRYFQLISRGALTYTNEFFNMLFNDPSGPYQGGVWELDGFDMTITYVINCDLSVNLIEVIKTYDLFPRPAAVGIKYVDTRFPAFGFGEFYFNFERGAFATIF